MTRFFSLFLASLTFIATSANSYDGPDLVTVDGIVQRNTRGQIHVRLKESPEQLFKLWSPRVQTQTDLNHLHDGDRVVGQGRILVIRGEVALDEVQILGIKRILGTWRDYRKNKTLRFDSFSQVTVSDRAQNTSSLSYYLLPVDHNQWNFFFADSPLKLGTIVFQDRKLNLQFVDLKTKELGESFELEAVQ